MKKVKETQEEIAQKLMDYIVATEDAALADQVEIRCHHTGQPLQVVEHWRLDNRVIIEVEVVW